MIDFQFLKDLAFRLGYDDVGFCDPSIPEQDIKAYQNWIKEKKHGELHYMENDIRCYPEKLFEGIKSVVIFLTYYKQKPLEFNDSKGLVASYARGCDYHNIHRSRLKKLIISLKESCSGLEAKSFSDSFPILERALAVKSGLGWLGKNNMLIHPKLGTYTLISGLLLNTEINNTIPTKRKDWGIHFPRCGSCRRCQDACPVGALDTPYSLDAKKCLSFHLIESKKSIPENIQKQNPGYVFGCDLCQESCPHNIKKPDSFPKDFQHKEGFIEYIGEDDIKVFESNPEKLFVRPLKRAGATKLKENLRSLKKNRRKGTSFSAERSKQ
ncbi:MAG: tRNA epoxyqueuosine(34) reductase QueG [Chlamydiales bacterium]|nr:tRNA epoxyqueuosine(34) reductase QueG [Chlamydiales bacterium]